MACGRCMQRSSVALSTGLTRWWSKPAWLARWRSAAEPQPVSAISVISPPPGCWRISVAGPNTLTIHDGHKERKATLTNGEYVFDRPSDLGRALIRLSFEADGVRGTGTASAVSHRGKNRKTAEDCGETLTITGRKA